jgi:lipopolysaccharide/colanic/teichoic acid biosynthesis glycosyltransferase
VNPQSQGGPGIPRWLDVAVAVCALILLSPLLAAIGLCVRLSSPGPVLFRQVRVGKGGRPFTLLKFRSMRPNGEGPLVTASSDARVTPVGRLLRRTKLDELPELWNVMRGDMALVGPRPEVPHYVTLDDPAWVEVLGARPGLTDPVTLALRGEEDLIASAGGDREQFYRSVLVPYKLEGYAKYLRQRTFVSDVRVLWATVLVICLLRKEPAPVLPDAAPRPHPSDPPPASPPR